MDEGNKAPVHAPFFVLTGFEFADLGERLETCMFGTTGETRQVMNPDERKNRGFERCAGR